jgi:hypothetical protein
MCLAPINSKDLESQYVVSKKCKDSDSHSWIIDRLGKI